MRYLALAAGAGSLLRVVGVLWVDEVATLATVDDACHSSVTGLWTAESAGDGVAVSAGVAP